MFPDLSGTFRAYAIPKKIKAEELVSERYSGLSPPRSADSRGN